MIRNFLKVLSSRMYSAIEKGAAASTDYRVFFKDNGGKIISPFHDIPLVASQENGTLYNMVVEIPRWTNAKMEIATKEPFNPIKQDVKKGKLRNVPNVFPYHGYIWNYGALAQTWENPSYVDTHTKAKGDNDPIDVCEIGSETLQRGQVVPVKVLGVMALIDDGETDWKLIVIKADDPLAEGLNDIGDVEVQLPGLLEITHDWFKNYKIPDGKPPNAFAFEGKAKGADFAKNIINETHEQWKTLMFNSKKDERHELDLQNTSVDKSEFKVSSDAADLHVKSQPEHTKANHGEQDEQLKLCYVKSSCAFKSKCH